MAKTPKAINEELAYLPDRLQEMVDAFQTLLATGASTVADYRNLRAWCQGFRAEIRAHRRELDSQQLTDHLVLDDDGADQYWLWVWELGTRRELLLIEQRLLGMEALADRLDVGQPQRQVVVKTGETFQSIAAREMGDWKNWQRLMEANGLKPSDLAAGQVLSIPQGA